MHSFHRINLSISTKIKKSTLSEKVYSLRPHLHHFIYIYYTKKNQNFYSGSLKFPGT